MHVFINTLGKRWLVMGLLGIFSFAVTSSFAASAALDNAGNYSAGTFTNGSNAGTGFGPWQITANGGAQVDLEDSTVGSGNINSGNDLSFMFYGSGDDYAEATRDFNAPLAEGDEFSVTIAYNWDGGARGVNILNASGAQLLNINLGTGNSLGATFTGQATTPISTDYFADATLEIVVKQIAGNQLDLTLTRLNDNYTTNLVSTSLSSPAAKVKFYNGGHPGNNVNYALFVNDLVITESDILTLNLQGQDAKAVGMTNVITVTRGGSTVNPADIALDISNAGVALIPTNVVFEAGSSVTNFTIEGLSSGFVTITANSDGYPEASLDVQVYDLGYDDTSYYPPGSFANSGNGGLGFQPWIIQNNDGTGIGFTNFAGVFIGDSTFGGSDVNDSSGTAFGLYANGQGGGTPFVNAIRPFNSELAVGQSVYFELGINFRDGAKGANLQNSGFGIFEVAVFADDYWYKIGANDPVNLNWDYASDSAIEVEVKRVASSTYAITITRRGSAPEFADLGLVDLGGTAPNEIRFFNFDNPGLDSNNIYFNRLALYSSEIFAELTITGNDGMVAGQTNVFTITRTGSTDDALTVDLASLDTDVATVAASVEIGIGQSSATFEVVAVSNGAVTVTAEALDTISDEFNFIVVDIAYDDTTYYPPATFDNSGNGGFGFSNWVISVNDSEGEGYTNFVGAFIGDSSAAVGDVNSSSDTAFGLYANKDGAGGPDPLAEATRPFDALGEGESITFKMGVNFRNGAKGVMFQNGGTWLFEVGIYGDDYVYNVRDQGDNPVSLGWEYAADTVINVIFSRTGANSYNVRLSREGSSPEDLLVSTTLSQPPDRVRFYTYYTDSGDVNNLYFNKLAIYTGVEESEFTDGIPNSWWEQYGIAIIDRTASGNPDGDVDANGVPFTNLDEYISDTNPTNSSSFFPNLILSATGGDVLSLTTGPTTNSRVYDVWWTTNIAAQPQEWIRYGLNVQGDDNGNDVTLQITNAVNSRIFRSGVSLP